MKLIFAALIALTAHIDANALPTADARYIAVQNALSNSHPRVRFAGLVALEKLVGADSVQFRDFAILQIQQIDHWQAQVRQHGPTVLEKGESVDDLNDRELKIIEILIFRGGKLNHYLRSYQRNRLGVLQIDLNYAKKLLKLLMESGRSGQDPVVIGPIVKVLSLAELAYSNRRTSPDEFTNYDETLRLILDLTAVKGIKDSDILGRLGDLFASLQEGKDGKVGHRSSRARRITTCSAALQPIGQDVPQGE